MRPTLFRLMLIALGFLLVLPLAAADEPSIHVRYRSADTVYLDAGRLAGLSEGDRLEIQREGQVLAIVEVVFVADHSASAQPIEDFTEELGEIRSGDLARPLGTLTPPEPSEPSPEPSSQTPRAESVRAQGTPYVPRARKRTTRISGVATFDVESYTDERNVDASSLRDSDLRDYDETTARLSLRGRDLGGLPLDLRIRMRSRQIDRGSSVGAGLQTSEDRDRLYELSLRWAPDSGRYEVSAGRLGAGPFTGIGYLDGVSGRYRVAGAWQVGAFYGSRPELTDLGFESAGTKMGVFSRWTAPDRGPWEVFLAGVREEDDSGTTRDVAILETRLGAAGGRWSLFQRAEFDVGSEGAGGSTAEDESQLTQLALALTGRLGDRSRFVLSYDRYDPVLLFEDPPETPADEFRDLLRQGLRASLHLGRPGELDVSISAGLREGEDDEESTTSFGLGIRRIRQQGLSVSGDLQAFSNPFTEGALVTLRSRYGFGPGHSVGVIVGSTAYERLGGDERVSGWARLETWFELPASLFARADVEVLAGDDAEGQRLRLGLGYRF